MSTEQSSFRCRSQSSISELQIVCAKATSEPPGWKARAGSSPVNVCQLYLILRVCVSYIRTVPLTMRPNQCPSGEREAVILSSEVSLSRTRGAAIVVSV